MANTNDRISKGDIAQTASRRIRKRIMVLMTSAMLTVALVFGMTFYVALLANESAVARQIPELHAVAAQLKNMLMTNTLVFAAIIIGSFLFLSSIVTTRMFRSLTTLYTNLLAVAEGPLPESEAVDNEDPFSPLNDALASAIASLRAREQMEITELDRIAEALSGTGALPYASIKLQEIIKGKKTMIVGSAAREETPAKRQEEDSLFIQPL
jgi:methyl-accepting chemotaxis protein